MTRPDPPQSLAEHRRELAGRPRPPAAGREAEEAAADRALARRIHAVQPAVPVEQAYTVLQALRLLHDPDRAGTPGDEARADRAYWDAKYAGEGQ
ncbi:hypothetical protein QFZ63_001586 [Streptomyces sp. B3I7]|uniref:hypothetical protein n=1 Tax=Streptomyces sp. B3I7 TaxID=3042269 RepID=UPI0027887459|nr:hypothetical protein [Streptomyces sp. B3I7]MDQ0809872.1 hypothetical protein [Streptomyces sp. B3I7]